MLAGCGGRGATAPAASPSPLPVTWQRFSAECPVLARPPYGLPARGKLSAVPSVDDAEKFETRCEYVAAAHLPLLSLHVTIARGAGGVARTEQDYDKERAAAGGLVSYDVVDISQLGDAAFALYDQGTWTMWVRVRSGNATAVLQFLVAPNVAKSWSVTAPLQQQVPILSAVTKDLLAGLG